MLQSYAWPGNVRELRNVMERMMIMVDGAAIAPENLPPGMRRPREQEAPGPAALPTGNDFESLKEARDAFESEFIRRKLAENDGNVSRTAEALAIQRSHLYRKLRALRHRSRSARRRAQVRQRRTATYNRGMVAPASAGSPRADVERDVKDALRARDNERLQTLRMLLAEIKNKSIELGRDPDRDEFTGAGAQGHQAAPGGRAAVRAGQAARAPGQGAARGRSTSSATSRRRCRRTICARRSASWWPSAASPARAGSGR